VTLELIISSRSWFELYGKLLIIERFAMVMMGADVDDDVDGRKIWKKLSDVF
jgi:hypothetical protein